MNVYRRGSIALSLAASVAVSLAAAPLIGVASSRGTIEVNSASVRGTANITDGAAVRTNQTASHIDLQNGVQMTLNQNSDAAVFGNHLELRSGAAQVAAKRTYGIDALGFRVTPTTAGTARVTYDRDRILVTAKDAPVSVSKNGVLLARVNAGTTYYFAEDDQEGGTAASAGKSAGKGKSTGGSTAAKAGLSTGAKWGIVAGVAAAGTGVGLGVALSGNDASR